MKRGLNEQINASHFYTAPLKKLLSKYTKMLEMSKKDEGHYGFGDVQRYQIIGEQNMMMEIIRDLEESMKS